MANGVAQGFERYRAFAAPGWEPPPVSGEAERLAQLLPDPRVWCLVAEDELGWVGHVTLVPSEYSTTFERAPELAHLRHLFIREDHWGTGLARDLHRRMLRGARAGGYERLRLFTPEGQARARRFYEREGWAQHGAAELHPGGVGFPVVEYRRTLSG